LTKSGRRSFEKILNVAVAVYAFQKVFSWAKIASGVFNVEQRSFTRQWDLTFVERTEPSSCAISP
jgi:hypothetical protein